MKKIYDCFILLVFLFTLPILVAQVQVGKGTTNTTSLPITSCHNFSYTQQIYSASDIQSSGNITTISFYYVSGGPATNSTGWTIYLGHTAKSSFSSISDWETFGNLNQVYTGTVSFPATTGWMTVTLDTPFAYNGTDNLLVAVDENQPGSNCSVVFQGSAFAAKGIHYRSNTTNPDPASPPLATAVLGTIPNIILGGIAQLCPKPSQLTASNITETTAVLGWTANGTESMWEIEWGPAGFAPSGSPNVTGINSTSYNLTGLNADTAYGFYVRANCGLDGNSLWVGPFEFTTRYVEVPPYTEGFITTDIPYRWNTSGWNIGSERDVTGNPGNNLYKHLNSTTPQGAFTMVTVGPVSSGMALTFDYKLANYAFPYDPPAINSGDFVVEVSTNFGSTYSLIEPVANNGVAGWQKKQYDLTAYNGQNVKIRITASRFTGDYDIAFDNFFIGTPPACQVPSQIAISNPTFTSADFSWNAANGETNGYEYVVMTAGTAPNTGSAVATGVVGTGITTVSVSGLTASTSYDFYVRTNCGALGLSPWGGPLRFLTGYCTPSSLGSSTYINNFSTTGGNTNISNLSSGFSPGGYFDGTSQAVETHATGFFNFNAGISGGPVGFSIWIDWNNDLVFDNVTEKAFHTSAYSNGPFTGTITVPAGTPVGDYRMRITADNSSANPSLPCGDRFRAEFEDYMVTVVPPPPCTAPFDLAVSNIRVTSADIEWSASPNETNGYEYVLMLRGEAPNVATAQHTATVSTGITILSLTGLASQTRYDMYIRTNCGIDGISDWSVVLRFITPPNCGEIFYDNGGAGMNYANNSNDVITIYAPNPGDMVRVAFTNFATESCCDFLRIYNGPDTSAPLIGTYSGTVSPGTVTSSHITGTLTFVFTSNSSVTATGWEANVTCIPFQGFTYQGGVWSPSSPFGVSTSADDVLVMDGTAVFNQDIELKTVSIYPGATLRVEDALKVHGHINNSGEMVFVSDAVKTGQLDMFPSTSTISGEITVQRYIPARRAFRFLTTSVSTTESIHQNWQEWANGAADDPNPGFGTHITGSVSGANGFDETPGGNPSMFTLSNTGQSWHAVANTNVNKLVAGVPYRIMVRGDRSINVNSNTATPQNTTLRATGTLFTGTKTVTGLSPVAGDFNFFGNPYQAVVDMTNVIAASTNINNAYYYIWDPTLNTRGAYVTVDLVANSNSSGSAANKYLQPGQAAFVSTLANAEANLTIAESHKAVAQPQTAVFQTQSQLDLRLYEAAAFAADNPAADGLRIKFSVNGNNAITPLDALKFYNQDENLASVNSGGLYSIEDRALPRTGEMIPLFTNNYRNVEYVFEAHLTGMEGVTVMVRDTYTGKERQLLNNETTLFKFHVDPLNEESKGANRFEVYFSEKILDIDRQDLMNDIVIYPNPASDIVHIRGMQIIDHIAVYNISGQKVLSQNGEDLSLQVNVSDLSTGVYILKVISEGQEGIHRLIKK